MHVDERTEAVRKALELAPGSILALAQAAGLSDRLLRMIRDGERRATTGALTALVAALEQMAGRHAQAAEVLRDVLDKEET